ncbi:hypothetical protein VP14_236 [Vibrio phage VPMCC14]|nr:hypothetical protein VP14_236 [Vibrio phage VPMCC14]
MKFKVLENTSSEAGNYTGMKDVIYGSIVEGEYICSKKNGIFVKGDEMIIIRGDPKAFNPKYKYTWADFEEVM